MAKVQTRRSAARVRHQYNSNDKYLSFESLISELLARFVKIPDTQTDSEIEDAIRRICLYLDLDQGLLIQWRQDKTPPMPTHSWTVPGGLPPPVSSGTEVVPWVHGQAMLGNIVMFSHVEDLPREAERDKEFFRASGRKSLISLPLKIGSRVIGVLVFASLHAEIPWPDEVVRRLKMTGDVFAGVLDRKKREQELEKRFKFEQLLSELSARFVNIDPERVDGEIEQSLRQVLEFFQVDRCALLKTLPDRKSWQIAFVSYAEGVPLIPEKTVLPVNLFPWVSSQILDHHKVVVFRTPDDLPPEAAIDKQTYHSWRIKSSLTIPILISGPADYGLAINAVSHERTWSEDYISRLRLLGEVFVNALERKRIDQALRESEERLSLAADSAGAGLWSMEVGSSMVLVNDRLRELFCFPLDEELTYETFLSAIHPEDREMVQRCVKQAVQGKGDINVEYRIVLPDKSIRWVMSRGRSYLPSAGYPTHLMGVSMNVTERKETEESLRRSEERYRTVADYTYDWEYWSASDGKLLYVSPSCERITGYSPQQFIDNPSLFRKVIVPDDRAVWDEHDHHARAELKTEEVQFRIMRRDGRIRWIEHYCQSVRNVRGEFLGLRASNRDITDRRLAEEALKESEAALRISQQNLKRLAGRLISAQEEELRRLSRELHDDLTQKLAVLAIEVGKLEQEMKKRTGSSLARSKKLSEIKDQLIRVSEEVHQISRQIHPSILDDLGLVRAIESECVTFLRRENVKVTFVKEDDIPAIPKDTALCLYRVVQESLKNISKHSRAESVEISLRSADNNMLVIIKDNGIGFDLQELQQKRGLGLASMRERVQSVKGDFSVESRPGHGTTINVRVPLTGNGE